MCVWDGREIEWLLYRARIAGANDKGFERPDNEMKPVGLGVCRSFERRDCARTQARERWLGE